MTFTTAARTEAEALSSGEVAFELVTITHPGLAGPIRLAGAAISVLSTDPHILGVTSGGADFLFLPFEFQPPEETEGGGGTATLTFPVWTLPAGGVADVAAALRGLSGPLSVAVAVFTTRDLDNPEETFPPLAARVVGMDGERITLELAAETLAAEPLGGVIFRPGLYPGLFESR